eukprot:m.74415 g.74415  ORF g.74415 m.74415 type:complete len:74 (-) comp14359_c0_seq6:133-354(-)
MVKTTLVRSGFGKQQTEESSKKENVTMVKVAVLSLLWKHSYWMAEFPYSDASTAIKEALTVLTQRFGAVRPRV